MRLLRMTFLAAVLAASLILAPSAMGTGCPEDDPTCPLPDEEQGCPPEAPFCWLVPPQSTHLNPTGVQADAPPAVLTDPVTLPPLEISLPAWKTVDPIPFASTGGSGPTLQQLPVNMRYQTPGDVSCGVQALGMAMEGLGSAAPSSSALLGFLQGQGMMYDFGTGVEELAHAAQSFGYRGSLPFHGWSLEDLVKELGEGRPVVIALGANGATPEGHFVTVTGISVDGKWVAYNDPSQGRQVISSEEFLRLWGLQGYCGVKVALEPASVAEGVDYAPWVALVAGMMVLVSATPLVKRRKGIGGLLESGAVGDQPPYPAPPGKTWVRMPVTHYGFKDVPVRKVMNVPVVALVRVQVDTKVSYEKRARYKTVRVDRGQWKHRRVTRYRMERYVRSHRRYRVRKRYTYRWGWRRYTGYRYEWRSTPVYGTRQVEYSTWERYWEPNWVNEQRFDGYEWIRHEEPVYDYVHRTVGTREVSYTTTEKRWGVISSGYEWQLRDLPQPQVTASPELLATLKPSTSSGSGTGGLVGVVVGLGEGSDSSSGVDPSNSPVTHGPTSTSTPEAIRTPAPVATPRVTPTGTPTFSELLESYERKAEEQAQRDYNRIDRCNYVEDNLDCYLQFAAERYSELGIHLDEIAQEKLENPLSQDEIADEFGDMVPAQLMEILKAENTHFLKQLGLNFTDPANYFPTYLNALKNKYPEEYQDSIAWTSDSNVMDEAIRDIIEDALYKDPYEWAISGEN